MLSGAARRRPLACRMHQHIRTCVAWRKRQRPGTAKEGKPHNTLESNNNQVATKHSHMCGYGTTGALAFGISAAGSNFGSNVMVWCTHWQASLIVTTGGCVKV